VGIGRYALFDDHISPHLFSTIEPVNFVLEQATARSMPTGWEQLRNQWEYAHATNFGFGLAEFIALTISILVDVPQTKNLSNNLGERSCFLSQADIRRLFDARRFSRFGS